MLANHVGSLAGRLSRLEGEAAALGKRIGLDGAPAAEPSRRDAAKPAGRPFLPVAGVAALSASYDRPAQSDFRDLGRIESHIALLEDDLSRLRDAVAEREIETMAYPYRLPVAGQGSRVSSTYGVRHDPFTGRLARHTGLDIRRPTGRRSSRAAVAESSPPATKAPMVAPSSSTTATAFRRSTATLRSCSCGRATS